MEALESEGLYAFLLIISLAGPLLYSFDKRISYYKNWKEVFVAIGLMMIVFIPWDAYFSYHGIWWFNHSYTLNVDFIFLPIEEWLFFIIIPFACVFIYEVMNFYLKRGLPLKLSSKIFYLLGFFLILLSGYYFQRTYTAVTFSLTGLSCIFLAYRRPKWIGQFLQMYLISWLPFLLINGALTGLFTEEAVVNYNSNEHIGLRILTIPVEDSIYSLLMLLTVITTYEYLKSKRIKPAI